MILARVGYDPNAPRHLLRVVQTPLAAKLPARDSGSTEIGMGPAHHLARRWPLQPETTALDGYLAYLLSESPPPQKRSLPDALIAPRLRGAGSEDLKSPAPPGSVAA